MEKNNPQPGNINSKLEHPKRSISSEEIANDYDCLDLVKIIGGLQLVPENHGKNVRIELFTSKLLKAFSTSRDKIKYTVLKDFFDSNLLSHYMEDPVSSFFTENIFFFGGNYTVFPGLNSNGSRILNLYLEGIFIVKNQLSETFKKKVFDGVILILSMGNLMAQKSHLQRNNFQEGHENKIKVPTEADLNKFKEAVTFKTETIEQLCANLKISSEIINEFVISPSDRVLDEDDPNKNPLLTRPITKKGDEFIFALPTATVNCLIEFIKRIAGEMLCADEVNNIYYKRQWSKVVEYANEMGWRETSIHLPVKRTDLSTEEGVFRFDNYKLVYINFIKKEIGNKSGSQEEAVKDSTTTGNQTRVDQVVDHLVALNGKEKHTYFVLNILGENGSSSFHIADKSRLEIQTLLMRFFEFETISLSENIDPLTIWKFAKSYNEARETTLFMPFADGILDSYAHFISNDGGFFDPEQERAGGLILSGSSIPFQRKILKDRDEHGQFRYYKGNLVGTPVIKHRNFAPIYIEREESEEHNLLLECFAPALWITNNQAKNREQKEIINIFTEAIIFWIYKMRESLASYFEEMDSRVIEVQVRLEDGLFEQSLPTGIEIIPEDLDFDISVERDIVHLKIPFDLSSSLLRSDNLGEKAIMKAVLTGLGLLLQIKHSKSTLTVETIGSIIEQSMQPPTAKMIVFFDSRNDLKLDTRNLLSLRKLQESEMSKIQDNLVRYLALPEPIPQKIADKKEKIKLANKIVATLLTKIVELLKEFDSPELVKWLIKMHETCVQARAYRKIHIPPKIACFSDFPTEISTLEKDDKELVNTALALRCLIEFITAKPHFGNRPPNIDDIDELLALMNQLINWGMISDGIDLGMDEPGIGLLPSGRIGLTRDFDENHLAPFAASVAESTVFQYVQNFEKKIEKKIVNRKIEKNSEVQEIDAAFTDEWEIELTKLLQIIGTLVQIVLDNDDSIIEIESTDLKSLVIDKLKGLISAEECEIGLSLLTLKEREAIDKAPTGYDKTDVYPWKYNRAVSYLRRPVVEIKKQNDKTFYYMGFRHLISSSENLQSLLFTGRLKAKDDGLLSAFISKVNKEKGAEFRKEVYDFLAKHSSLKTIPYEVKINTNGHLIADKDYGDIDVLCIDKKKKVLYSIECKNTVSARVMHEMKTEMDKYLGRGSDAGLIQKHVERDVWIKANLKQFSIFITSPEDYKIKSLVLTSEDIPLPYLLKENLALPMLSFNKLQIQGIDALDKI